MPTYSYLCTKPECMKPFDYFHLGSNDKVEKCPHCGAEGRAERAVSNTLGHVVKGANAKNRYGLKR